jgi:ribose transport system substrate-binding protein
MRVNVQLVVAAGVAAILVPTGAGACSQRKPIRGTPTVGFVVPSTTQNFAIEMVEGFRASVRDVGGVDLVVKGPPVMDANAEVALFAELQKEAKDGISVFSLAPELFSPPLAAAAKQGIPLIAVDSRPGPASEVTLFVGNDNYELGQMLADEAIEQLPADASGVVVLGTPVPGAPVLDFRAKGIRERFKERLPKVDVLGPFDTKQDPVANLSAWTSLVRANPTALAFLGTGDADGWNLADIRQRTHGKWLAGAFDLDPKSLAAVASGELLLVSPEHFVKGAVAGRLQADHAKRRTALPKGWIFTPGLTIDAGNVADITKRQSSTQAKEAWFATQLDGIARSADLRPIAQAR